MTLAQSPNIVTHTSYSLAHHSLPTDTHKLFLPPTYTPFTFHLLHHAWPHLPRWSRDFQSHPVPDAVGARPLGKRVLPGARTMQYHQHDSGRLARNLDGMRAFSRILQSLSYIRGRYPHRTAYGVDGICIFRDKMQRHGLAQPGTRRPIRPAGPETYWGCVFWCP